jgi:hypothetical protein
MSNKQEFELIAAIGALLDDEILREQFIELQQVLKNDPAARKIYVQECQTHFLLTEFFSKLRNQPTAASVINALQFPANIDSSHDAPA